ncbi:B-cell receptor CD22-like [Polypterus senegalus]|uniref:B-cell receptor CD22-like n=1 Tax=Polypterus senegalus TaxID=55291 RepID=UPI0019665EED|nr:B-cell receptor CD22-like [Polypterus senegalus]
MGVLDPPPASTGRKAGTNPLAHQSIAGQSEIWSMGIAVGSGAPTTAKSGRTGGASSWWTSTGEAPDTVNRRSDDEPSKPPVSHFLSFERYSYNSNGPKKFVAVWYQYQSSGYPLVYDGYNPGNVIDKFRGRTYLVGNVRNGNCSLKINDVTRNLNGEKIYTWIDPDNIGSGTYKFYERTVQLNVIEYASPPDVSVEGEREGDMVALKCSTVHTCPPSPPAFTWSYLGGTNMVEHTEIGEGKWKSTAWLQFNASDVDHERKVTCTVKHPGGRTVERSTTLSIKFAPKKVTVQLPASIVEGSKATLGCKSDGNPKPQTFKWYKIEEENTTSLENGELLTITPHRRGDVRYYCEASNGIGGTKSEAISLVVQYPPEISLDSKCFIKENVISCHCEVDSRPAASVTWNNNGSADTRGFNVTQTTSDSGKVTGILSGSLVEQLNISCFAENQHGSSERHLEVVTVTADKRQQWKEKNFIVVIAVVATVIVLCVMVTAAAWKMCRHKKKPEFDKMVTFQDMNLEREKQSDEEVYANTPAGNEYSYQPSETIYGNSPACSSPPQVNDADDYSEQVYENY